MDAVKGLLFQTIAAKCRSPGRATEQSCCGQQSSVARTIASGPNIKRQGVGVSSLEFTG
jgi:hypothetical protein